MNSIHSPLAALASIIEALNARSVLVCSRSELTGLEQVCTQFSAELTTVVGSNPVDALPNCRFDLVVIADCLEQLSVTEGQQLLGRIRNIHSNHIAVLISPNESSINDSTSNDSTTWNAAEFYAFGMKKLAVFERIESTNLILYTYAIESYNHKREWNTARFWANPENFGRYWW
ncbi:MAG: DUF6231 family protein [Pseudomonadales bacterium]